MKRNLIYMLIGLMLLQLQAFAVENKKVLNLKTETSYILPVNSRPMNLKISNSDAVKVYAITNIDDEDSSLLITTVQEGISYVTFNLKDKEITVKLLIDNMADEDESLLKLDVLEEFKEE